LLAQDENRSRLGTMRLDRIDHHQAGDVHHVIEQVEAGLGTLDHLHLVGWKQLCQLAGGQEA
jgi:hypothetical protein